MAAPAASEILNVSPALALAGGGSLPPSPISISHAIGHAGNSDHSSHSAGKAEDRSELRISWIVFIATIGLLVTHSLTERLLGLLTDGPLADEARAVIAQAEVKLRIPLLSAGLLDQGSAAAGFPRWSGARRWERSP